VLSLGFCGATVKKNEKRTAYSLFEACFETAKAAYARFAEMRNVFHLEIFQDFAA
jgi:hypothetical protein